MSSHVVHHRDSRAAVLGRLDQHGAAIDDDHLAAAVAFAHQVDVGLGEIVGLADTTDWKFPPDVAVHRLTIGLGHVAPQLRLDHAGTDRIDPDGREFHCQSARQRLHRTADARGHRPALLRAQSGNAVRQGDRPARPDVRAAVFHGHERAPEAQIDEAVRPVLAVKIRMGLFEHPYVDLSKTKAVLGDPAAREYARVAAERTMVLLRNQNHTLPVSKNVSSIAVIGPLANEAVDLDGGWGVQGETPAITVEEGLRKKFPSAKITYSRGGEIRRTIPSRFDDFFPGAKKAPPRTDEQNSKEIEEAIALARASDLSVLVLGELANMSGEYASRYSLELPGRQEELLEKVVALGKPVVLVLVSGRPLNISWASEHVPAIVMAWQPGTEAGNAIANILAGDANPGGKLPVTWPRSAGQEPLYYSRNLTQYPETDPEYRSRYWEGPTTPLYPFGFGLSYTTFSVSNLQLSKTSLKSGESLEATAQVSNTGSVPGDEVVQLYIHQRAGSTSRPMRELKGFECVPLRPGESKTVHFTLGPTELTYWSTARKAWVEEPEEFDVWVGNSSTAESHATFKVVE